MSISICSSLLVYGENCFDRIAANIAQSKIINSINKVWAQDLPLSGDPAPKELQELGLQAQREIGVPPNAIVPIRVIALDKSECEAAHADIHEICVNSSELGSSELDKRFTMLHEAGHIKYNDNLCCRLLFLASFLTVRGIIKSGTGFTVGNSFARGNIAPIAVGLVSLWFSNRLVSRYGQYVERRADTQALLAMKCHVCVNECSDNLKVGIQQASDSIRKITELLKRTDDGSIKLTKEEEDGLNKSKENDLKWIDVQMNNGYLLPDEMKSIAQKLKAKKLICPEHQSQSAAA